MVAKVSLGTVVCVWGVHSSTVCVAQCSLVVSDHWQAAAQSVGEIITIVELSPSFLSLLPIVPSFPVLLMEGFKET